MRKEMYSVKCPEHILIGNPWYWKTMSRENLVVDFKPAQTFDAAVSIEERGIHNKLHCKFVDFFINPLYHRCRFILTVNPDCLSRRSKAVNIRAVILTSLYNAVMTTTSYFTNLYAYHSANPQSIRG